MLVVNCMRYCNDASALSPRLMGVHDFMCLRMSKIHSVFVCTTIGGWFNRLCIGKLDAHFFAFNLCIFVSILYPELSKKFYHDLTFYNCNYGEKENYYL